MLAKPSPEQIAALPYRISRTPSNSLPIYLLRKRGGNLHQTKLRKIEGNIAALRTDLKEALQLEDKDVVINQLTKQIIIRVCSVLTVEMVMTDLLTEDQGHRKPDVAKFLEERQF
jgi:large subunit ribosomal protein L49